MENFKSELQGIMNIFSNSMDKLNSQYDAAIQNYQGSYLEEETTKINTQRIELKHETQMKIEQTAEKAKEQLQGSEIKGKDLNVADFTLLDPQRVKLTQSEFDELAGRYVGNRAMCIALRTYANECNLKFQDYTDIKNTCSQIDDLARSAISWVYSGKGIFDIERAAMLGTSIIF